jgi:tryptophan-rich sensory protein
MDMKRKWKVYAFWIGLAQLVGALIAWLTRKGVDWYNNFAVKPPLNPPPWVFPVVWTILYALMGFGAARVSLAKASESRSRGRNLFVVQLALNFLWSILFFNYQNYGLALVLLAVLWLLIAWMALEFGNADSLAGWLQIPYLAWVGFALFLNFWVWRLNG